MIPISPRAHGQRILLLSKRKQNCLISESSVKRLAHSEEIYVSDSVNKLLERGQQIIEQTLESFLVGRFEAVRILIHLYGSIVVVVSEQVFNSVLE